MKQIYVCETCGAHYDDYTAAYECEASHEYVVLSSEKEIRDRFTWEPGVPQPKTVVLYTERGWGEGAERIYYEYKFAKVLSAATHEKIEQERKERTERERREFEEWAARAAEKKAKEEAAKQETAAE